MKHFLSSNEATHFQSLIAKALEYKSNPLKDVALGKGKRMGLIFLNPSMRTRLSTEIAAKNLGMDVIVFNVGQDGCFAVANVTTFFVLSSWCKSVSGDGGASATCDAKKDRASTAAQLRGINIVSGIGLIATYVYGVYDGVSGYRRRSERQPFLMPTSGGGVVGISGSF